ncbi:MAG: hypothetical protein M1831_001965 [Alyxoria varia]|nr:MAG: hypothetical protein M1831_001965 [Alyxoria varia]
MANNNQRQGRRVRFSVPNDDDGQPSHDVNARDHCNAPIVHRGHLDVYARDEYNASIVHDDPPPSHVNPNLNGMGVWTGNTGGPSIYHGTLRHSGLEALMTLHENPVEDLNQQIYSFRLDEQALATNLTGYSNKFQYNVQGRIAAIRRHIRSLEQQRRDIIRNAPRNDSSDSNGPPPQFDLQQGLDPTATPFHPLAQFYPHPRNQTAPAHTRYKGGWVELPEDYSGEPLYCNLCWDPMTEFYRPACQHMYCHMCLVAMVKDSVSADSSRFPLKCCNQEVDDFASVFDKKDSSALVTLHFLYSLKMVEYSTPAFERRYCGKASCGSFIPTKTPKNRVSPNKEVVSCPICFSWNCVECGKLWHHCDASPKCEKPAVLIDEEEALFQLAATQGWKRCPQCGSMIDRVDGCPQMQCRCGTSFCFDCGKEWYLRCQCDHDEFQPAFPIPVDGTAQEVQAAMQANQHQADEDYHQMEAFLAGYEAEQQGRGQ